MNMLPPSQRRPSVLQGNKTRFTKGVAVDVDTTAAAMMERENLSSTQKRWCCYEPIFIMHGIIKAWCLRAVPKALRLKHRIVQNVPTGVLVLCWKIQCALLINVVRQNHLTSASCRVVIETRGKIYEVCAYLRPFGVL